MLRNLDYLVRKIRQFEKLACWNIEERKTKLKPLKTLILCGSRGFLAVYYV